MRQFSEANFSTVENDITKPEFANYIKRLVNSFRRTYLISRGTNPASAKSDPETALRNMVTRKKYVFLGEIEISDQPVNIWVKKLPIHQNGLWVPADDTNPAHIIVNVEVIISNPALAVSTIVHEVIHGIQPYKKFSDKYYQTPVFGKKNKLDYFFYFAEPSEMEAQFAELAHRIVNVFNRKLNKATVLNVVREVILAPRQKFLDDSWYQSKISPQYLADMFGIEKEFISIICRPPDQFSNSKRYQTLADNNYRKFKQKLYSLYQALLRTIN